VYVITFQLILPSQPISRFKIVNFTAALVNSSLHCGLPLDSARLHCLVGSLCHIYTPLPSLPLLWRAG